MRGIRPAAKGRGEGRLRKEATSSATLRSVLVPQAGRELRAPDRERRVAGREQRGAGFELRTEDRQPRVRLRRLRSQRMLGLVWVPPLLLTIFGLCMMLSVSASVNVAGGRYQYLRDQALALGIGLVFFGAAISIPYHKWRKASLAVFAVTLMSLALVHIPKLALTAGGARSWIGIGDGTFQPSEFAKLSVILLGAHLLSSPRVAKGWFFSYMWPFGVLGFLVCLLVFLEGDLGTAVIIAAIVLGLLWMGGLRMRHWLLVAATGLAAVVGATLASDEKLSRVTAFLNPYADPQGSGFQLIQSLVALDRGGLWGVGPGQSVQKFQYLPQAHTDMIYAIVGEEFGILGTGAVIALFLVFAVGCWRLASRCADPMGRLLIGGCGAAVTLQAVINIGGVTGALPLTGVPLPFISYGGNSLVVMLTAVGLILGVARRMPWHATARGSSRYDNVTRLDRWRGYRGSRSARLGAR